MTEDDIREDTCKAIAAAVWYWTGLKGGAETAAAILRLTKTPSALKFRPGQNDILDLIR